MNPRAAHLLAVMLAAAAATGGCDWIDQHFKKTFNKRQRKIDDLTERNRELARENQLLRAKIPEFEEQIRTLQALGKKRLAKLFHVRRIELSRYTGGVDLDDEGGHDAVKVFLQPLDQDSDPIKATGHVKIQLYDLAQPQGKNLLGEYEWPLEKLSKRWTGGFLAYHYALPCAWKTRPKHKEITVRAEFTDYLTGRKFTAQKVCEVNLPAPRPTTRPATQPVAQPPPAGGG